MIIEADFLNHWKIQALVNAVGEAAAYKALIALWGHCQTRRAWEFQISPEMLAGICKFSGSASKLWDSMLSLKLIDPAAENGWFQVHQWGKTNIALVARWAGGVHLKSHDYPARGLHHRTADQAKPPAKPGAKLPPQAVSRDTAHAAAIGLDGIGLDGIPPVVPQGGQEQAAAVALTPDSSKVDSDTSETGISDSKKKKRAGRVVEPLAWPDGWKDKRREVMEDWLRYKSEKGQRYKPTGFAALLRKLEGLPVERLRAVVEESMSANYSGLFPERQGVVPARPVAVQKPDGKSVKSWAERQSDKDQAQSDELDALPRLPVDDPEPEWPWREISNRLYGHVWAEWSDVPEDNRREMSKENAPHELPATKTL